MFLQDFKALKANLDVFKHLNQQELFSHFIEILRSLEYKTVDLDMWDGDRKYYIIRCNLMYHQLRN